MSTNINKKLSSLFPQQQQQQQHSKQSNAAILFPAIAKELKNNPSLARLTGLFVVEVLHRDGSKEEWYILFNPPQTPYISLTRPSFPSPPPTSSNSPSTPSQPTRFPIVFISLTDADLLNIVTGGMTGLKAFSSNRVKIVGDMMLAKELEELFVKAGGVEKVMKFLEGANLKKGGGGGGAAKL